MWVSPQATAMRFVQPLRSHCPNWLLPVASAVPSARTATVKFFPQATPTTSDQPPTSHWPKSLFPVARTLPSARKATVCNCPAAMPPFLALGRETGTAPSSGTPHRSQNLAWSRRTAPQAGQIFSTLVPHLSQNRAPGRRSTPQALHFTINRILTSRYAIRWPRRSGRPSAQCRPGCPARRTGQGCGSPDPART